MPVRFHISGGSNVDREALVTDHNALSVAMEIPDVPPANTPNRYRYLSGLLGTGGLNSGTTNQNVNGSATAQEFYISASNDYDIRIIGIVLVIADSAVAHNAWGNVAALATGYDIISTESGEDTYIINAAKTGGQAIAQSGFFNSYGDGALSFELTNWTSTEDAQTIYFPIGEFVPGGLRLGRGSRDRLTAVVRDDLTDLTEQFVRVFGYRHYP